MKNSLLIIAVLLLAAGGGLAQSVDAIQKRYADIAEKARLCEWDEESGEIGELVMNTLDVNARNHQWRAVGIYRPVYKFFYKGVDNDERRLYPDQLVFVKADRRISAGFHYEEFLFSETGTLIYYFRRIEGDETATPKERHVYFSSVKPLRIIDDGKARDKFSAGDIKVAAEISRLAGKFKELFIRSISL